jgi:glutamate formiminotransferase/formiminotetrahydrofolate cyclodeaminase
VAALAGALGAALAGMVANLTVGKKDYRQVDGEMRRLAAAAQALKDRLLRAVDLDTEAFAQVMAAMRLPRKTEEERGTRSAALEAATQAATKVPLEVCRACVEVLGLARAAAARGFSGSLSDAGVAAAMARAALDGAFYNVRINLKALSERGFVERVEAEAQELRRQGTGLADEIAAKVLGELCAA